MVLVVVVVARGWFGSRSAAEQLLTVHGHGYSITAAIHRWSGEAPHGHGIRTRAGPHKCVQRCSRHRCRGLSRNGRSGKRVDGVPARPHPRPSRNACALDSPAPLPSPAPFPKVGTLHPYPRRVNTGKRVVPLPFCCPGHLLVGLRFRAFGRRLTFILRVRRRELEWLVGVTRAPLDRRVHINCLSLGVPSLDPRTLSRRSHL